MICWQIFSRSFVSGNDIPNQTIIPAYDLVNTRKGNFKSAHWKKTGQATSNDFIEFGKRTGVQGKRLTLPLAPFLEMHQSVIDLIDRSFLDDTTKKTYIDTIRLNATRCPSSE